MVNHSLINSKGYARNRVAFFFKSKYMNDKVYVVMSDEHKLSLQTRTEVDAWIKDAEEAEGSLAYTVLGSINIGGNTIPSELKFYLFTIKQENSIIYDIVEGTNEETAKAFCLKRPRYKRKHIEIKRTQELTDLINKFYE